MVAETRMPDDRDAAAVRVEDLVPLRSRVSWPAIFAGAVLALAIFFVLTLLGGAIGLSVYDNVNPNTLNIGAAVWAIVSTILALFVGGWFVSQATVGENKCEAAVHGIIMWGVVFGLMLGLASMGVRAGFGAMVGVASIMDRNEGQVRQNFDAFARSTDPNAAPADRARDPNANPADRARDAANNAATRANEMANDPAQREAARERVATASWWTLFGVLLSMASAIGGALAGSGPTFRLLTVGGFSRTGVTRRETVHT